jgi:universal stress protein A
MKVIKRILAPVDFSPCSAAALEFASGLAEAFGATIDVLHVWELPKMVMPELLVLVPGGSQASLAQFARDQVGKHLDELTASFKGTAPIQQRIEAGDPAQTIVRLAEGDRYDLIVMGTHGRQGISHLLVGSVAEKVLRMSTVPVVIVPRRSSETPSSSEAGP